MAIMVSNDVAEVATNGHAVNGQPEALEVTMNYYLDTSLGGITHYTPGSAGVYRRKFDSRSVQIRNMRGQEDDFDIHTQSFKMCPFTTAAKEFTDDEIRSVMYSEAQEFLKKMYVRGS
jgi:hypothetical protein